MRILPSGKLGLFLLMLASLLQIGGCVERTVTKEKRLLTDALVKVSLRKISHNDGSIFVFGKLSITGISRRIQSADLNCVGISINNLSSETLYVDSVAHVLTDKFLAKNGEVNVSVYWLFKEPFRDDDFSNFEIILNKNRDQRQPCLVWSP